MPSIPYGENIAKWGELSRVVLKDSALVKLFEEDGIKESELRDIDTTEQEAEAADRLQRDAIQAVQSITKELITEKEVVVGLFGELKRKAANAIGDLEEAKQIGAAQSLQDIDFSSAATPKIKGEPQEEEEEEGVVSVEATEGNAALEEGEEEEAESPAAQRESKSQKAIARAARRVANYLEGKEVVLQALHERKLAPDFLKTLKEKSERMENLRNERALALGRKKSATKAEHEATRKHIKARGKVEPTATTLAKKNEDLKALMSLHLNRKS